MKRGYRLSNKAAQTHGCSEGAGVESTSQQHTKNMTCYQKEVKTAVQKSGQNFGEIIFFYRVDLQKSFNPHPSHPFFNNWCVKFNLAFPLYLL